MSAFLEKTAKGDCLNFERLCHTFIINTTLHVEIYVEKDKIKIVVQSSAISKVYLTPFWNQEFYFADNDDDAIPAAMYYSHNEDRAPPSHSCFSHVYVILHTFPPPT
jgi:hypothetical protein